MLFGLVASYFKLFKKEEFCTSVNMKSSYKLDS